MGIRSAKLLIAFLLIPSLVYGAAIQGKEEGSVVGYCKSIDFVGAAQTLTASGLDCTLTNTAEGGAGTGDVDSVGDCASGACLDGTSDGGTWIKFYDAQGAGQLITGDLTGARVWTLPNATGTVALTSGLHAAVTLSVAADTLLDLSTQEIGLDTQTANLVFAGPASGAAATPTFRTLVDDDINWATTTDLAAGGAVTWTNYAIESDGITGIADTEILIGTGAGTGNFAALSGDVTMTNAGAVSIGANKVNDTHVDWGTGANQVSTDDITEGSTNKFEGTTAGDYLTLTGEDIDLDAEIYTKTIGVVLETPADADAFLLWKTPYALTITDIDCVTGAATSAVIDIQECDSAGANCATVDAAITCDADGAADDGTLSNGGIDANDWIKLDIGTVTGTVKYVAVTIKYTPTD